MQFYPISFFDEPVILFFHVRPIGSNIFGYNIDRISIADNLYRHFIIY